MRNLIDLLIQNSKIQINGIHPRLTEDVDIVGHACKYGIPVFDSISINDSVYLNKLNNLDVDYFISCNEKQIFKRPLLELPKRGSLNLHCGCLPLQRGGGGIYSAFINEQSVGITIHAIDESIDGGDIYAQIQRPIEERESITDIKKWTLEVGPRLYYNTILGIDKGQIKPRKQVGLYSYTPAMPKYDNVINWCERSKLIHNRIRGRQSPVYCISFVDHKPLYILGSELTVDVANFRGAPGQVIARTDRGNVVKTGDNALLITLVAYDEKMPFIPNFKISTTFNLNLVEEYFELSRRLSTLEMHLTKMVTNGS